MKQYHDKFDLHFRHGMKISREDLKGLHMMHLSQGSKITLIHFKANGMGCIDVKFNLKNIDEDRDIRVIYTVEDDKLVKGREVEDSCLSIAKAKCSGSIYNAFRRFELPDKQVLTSLP